MTQRGISTFSGPRGTGTTTRALGQELTAPLEAFLRPLCNGGKGRGAPGAPRSTGSTSKAASDGNPGTQAGMLARGGAGARRSRVTYPASHSEQQHRQAPSPGSEARAASAGPLFPPHASALESALRANSQQPVPPGQRRGLWATRCSRSGQTSASVRSLENTELSQWQKPKDLLTTSLPRTFWSFLACLSLSGQSALALAASPEAPDPG